MTTLDGSTLQPERDTFFDLALDITNPEALELTPPKECITFEGLAGGRFIIRRDSDNRLYINAGCEMHTDDLSTIAYALFSMMTKSQQRQFIMKSQEYTGHPSPNPDRC